MTIHYEVLRTKKSFTACGLDFNTLNAADIVQAPALSDFIGNVDCGNCLRTNECRAAEAELALAGKE